MTSLLHGIRGMLVDGLLICRSDLMSPSLTWKGFLRPKLRPFKFIYTNSHSFIPAEDRFSSMKVGQT